MFDLPRRIAAARLQLVLEQVARVPLPLIIYNVAVVWLVWRLGFFSLGLPWLAVCLAIDAYRWHMVRSQRLRPADTPEPVLRRFSVLFVINAALQTLPAVVMFSQPISDVQYIYTLLAIGRTAGAISTSGGVVWAFGAHVGLVGSSLVVGWMLTRDWPLVVLGGLIGMLFAMLMMSMLDQSRMLCRLVQVAWDNERLADDVSVERDRARAASDSKTRFFAAASHDLRQPLHALSINTTALDVMAQRLAEPHLVELSRSIGRALRQSNSLLDSLLDISQLEANVVCIQRRPVLTSSLLHAVRDEFAPAAAQRGLALSVQAPSAAEALWLDTDPKQLRRVLANLVSNALKFTQQGGVTLSACPSKSRGGAVRLTVTDTGPGIPEAEQERVFEDFYQIGNPSRDRSQGLGLGLSIVRRTAALLGVTVTLTSRPGEGTRFDVDVPASSEAAVDDTAARGETPQELDGAKPPNLDVRVLAIDDEVEILESLAVLLPELGCEVRCATGLATAVALLNQGFVPALLIVDHRLRGETSLDVLAALQRRLGPVPTIVVTGDTAPQELQRLQHAGAHVLHKPIDGLQLAQTLRGALDCGDASTKRSIALS